MKNKKLHIVSFAIPDPPNYGGVIDVFYKIKALSTAGFEIILHCFQYDDRKPSDLLAEMCTEVQYYTRQTNWRKAIGTTPYIMSSRTNEDLINRLKEDNNPVLLEGLHTSSIANHPAFKDRNIAIRMHNIEWDYYAHLAAQESNWLKKAYFKIEAARLKNSKSVLAKVDKVFTISPAEQAELSKLFNNCSYLPAFHPNDKVEIKDGVGDYILYHGNLSVAENKAAIDYIIFELCLNQKLNLPIIIAGKGNELDIKKYQTLNLPNVSFHLNPTDKEMNEFITNAQIHLLITFQNTGIKLKLLNALYKGRHVVTNSAMVAGTGLEPLCNIVQATKDYNSTINSLFEIPVGSTEVLTRTNYLEDKFSNSQNVKVIRNWLE